MQEILGHCIVPARQSSQTSQLDCPRYYTANTVPLNPSKYPRYSCVNRKGIQIYAVCICAAQNYLVVQVPVASIGAPCPISQRQNFPPRWMKLWAARSISRKATNAILFSSLALCWLGFTKSAVVRNMLCSTKSAVVRNMTNARNVEQGKTFAQHLHAALILLDANMGAKCKLAFAVRPSNCRCHKPDSKLVCSV
jgi:hypothetical protein